MLILSSRHLRRGLPVLDPGDDRRELQLPGHARGRPQRRQVRQLSLTNTLQLNTGKGPKKSHNPVLRFGPSVQNRKPFRTLSIECDVIRTILVYKKVAELC